MSDILRIIGIGICGGILSMTVRRCRSEFGILTALATVLIIFGYTADILGKIITGLEELINETGVDIQYFSAVIKVVGIAYITQFGAEILRDGGENAVALKLELAGKMFIMAITLPIISDFLHTCIEAVNLI